MHAMNTHWEVNLYIHDLLTSGLDGSEWSASGPGGFNKGETTCSFTYWVGDVLGLRAGVDCEEEKFLDFNGT